MQISRVDQLPAFRTKVNPASRFVEWTPSGQVATSAVEFQQLVSKLTQALENHIHNGRYVVILHDRTRVLSLAAEFAAMSLGGIVCPLTWASPYKRPQSAIANLGNPLILYPIDLEEQQQLPLEYDLMPIPDLEGMVEGTVPNFDALTAMVVTTSGTSGAPKGVVLSHDAVTSTLISALAVSPAVNKAVPSG